MFCPDCGAKIDTEAKFCPACGTAIQNHIKRETSYHPDSGVENVPVSNPNFTRALESKIVNKLKSFLQIEAPSDYPRIAVALVIIVCALILFLQKQTQLNWNDIIRSTDLHIFSAAIAVISALSSIDNLLFSTVSLISFVFGVALLLKRRGTMKLAIVNIIFHAITIVYGIAVQISLAINPALLYRLLESENYNESVSNGLRKLFYDFPETISNHNWLVICAIITSAISIIALIFLLYRYPKEKNQALESVARLWQKMERGPVALTVMIPLMKAFDVFCLRTTSKLYYAVFGAPANWALSQSVAGVAINEGRESSFALSVLGVLCTTAVFVLIGMLLKKLAFSKIALITCAILLIQWLITFFVANRNLPSPDNIVFQSASYNLVVVFLVFSVVESFVHNAAWALLIYSCARDSAPIWLQIVVFLISVLIFSALVYLVYMVLMLPYNSLGIICESILIIIMAIVIAAVGKRKKTT